MSERITTPFTMSTLPTGVRNGWPAYWYGTCVYKATISLLSRKATVSVFLCF
jgi:hypothetical protein